MSCAQWAPVAAPSAALAARRADGRFLRGLAACRRGGAPRCSATQEGKRRGTARTVVMPRRRAAGEEDAAPRPPEGAASVRNLGVAAAAAGTLAALAAPPELAGAAAAAAAEFAKHFFIGGFAAAVGTAAVYPLDVVKTRMQVEPSRWAGAFSCAADTLRDGGVRGLYAGMGAQMVGVAPEKSFKIMAYNACHASLLAQLGASVAGADLPLPWEALAGGAAGAAQTLVACPLEAAKIPMQCVEAGAERKRLFAILQELGPEGLYRGLDVCLARDVAGGAIFFACFAAAKHAFAGSLGPSPGDAAAVASAAFAVKLAAGAVAGIPSAVFTTPLDVVKTRLQAQSEGDGTGPRYTDAWDCATQTVAQEGWGALMSGAGARVARLSPQLGITLALYEVLDPVR